MNPPLQPKMQLSLWAMLSVSVVLTLFWLFQSIPLALTPVLFGLSIALVALGIFLANMRLNNPKSPIWLSPLLILLGILVSLGCLISDYDSTLARAARGGSTAWLVEQLDSNHSGPDIVDSHGNSLLMKAAQYGHTDTVKELLRRGARTDYRDGDGDTALSVAERYHHTEIIELLQKAGAKR